MNFKILIVVCAVLLYEASARNVNLSRSKRQLYDQPYIAAQGYPGRPVLSSPGGLVNGLITNLLNNAAYTGRQVATLITGSLAGVLQSLGQAGSDAQSTLVGTQHPSIVYGYDFYPHPRPEQIGNPRPPPNPNAQQPEKRTIDATKGFEDGNDYNSNLRSIERKSNNQKRPGAFGGSLLNYWFVPNRPSSSTKPPKPSKPSGGSSSSSSSPSSSSSSPSSSSSSSSSDSSSSSSSTSQLSDQQGSQQQQQQQQQPALPVLDSVKEQFENLLHFGGQLNVPLANGGGFSGFGQYLQNYQMNSQYGKPNDGEKKKQ